MNESKGLVGLYCSFVTFERVTKQIVNPCLGGGQIIGKEDGYALVADHSGIVEAISMEDLFNPDKCRIYVDAETRNRDYDDFEKELGLQRI